MNRRDVIKSLAVAPFVGGFMATGSALAGSRNITEPLLPGSTIYESIGVEPIINCRGTFTILGGSVERPEVLEAIHAASGYFVQYDELAYGIGQRLAELTGAEFGIVTAGCAAAMKHATAGCVTGGNPERLIRIPDLKGMEKTEVISPRHSRNVYDHSIRNIGVTMIDVETPEELSKALSNKTAMIYMMTSRASETGQPLSVEAICEIAKPFNVPVLVDAAAEDLTIPNVHFARGATMVAYSGGKAICGPQCAGLLLGPKSLLMSAWQASSPHHGPGRDNKVGKEEMLGMLAAVEAWTTRDHKGEWKEWEGWLKHITDELTKIDGVTASVRQPRETISGLNNRAPRLTISWDQDKLHITGEEVAEEVARNKPRLAIGSGRRRSRKDDNAGEDSDRMTSININPAQMQPGQAEIVADRLYGILSQTRKPKSNKMKAPAANVAGRWKVDIDFSSSKSTHTLFLEQDGNWIQGSHQGDFTVRELVGMIEGDQVKLRSNDRHVADRITNIFHGKLSGDTITGSIFLGEYLTAEFKATKNPYEVNKNPVVVPGGPPLAT